MSQKRSLTPAQIQYLRIGPKVNNLVTASRRLQDSLNKFEEQGSDPATTLSNIPKLTYGNLQNTVSNFGVLLHRNFVGTTTLHQAQKYGKIAFIIDPHMQEDSDKPLQDKKAANKKNNIDARISIKAIFDHNGNKLLLTLKSFTIESLQTHRIIQTLPLAYLKLLANHVTSQKLVKVLEGAMRQQGSTVTIDYEKLQGKASHSQNSQARYQQGPYLFQRAGQQFTINLPALQIYHSQSNYRVNVSLQNKDILQILESDFDNVESIIRKYINLSSFETYIQGGQVQVEQVEKSEIQ